MLCSKCAFLCSCVRPGAGKWFRFSVARTVVNVPVFSSLERAEGGIWNMRKSVWIILTVLLVAVGAPNAHADSFSVTFTGFTPEPTASDVTFPSPTLDIMWQGFTFLLTLPASSLPTDSYNWDGALGCGKIGGCEAHFTIQDTTTGTFTTSITPVPSTFAIGRGNLTFTPVATPEPSSVALMLLGGGLVFVTRRRIGQRLPSQAS